MTKRSRPWVRDMRPPISSNIDINMLAVYKSSELYREIDAGRWIEAGEIEKYEEIRKLTLSLEIPAEFAMPGASNPMMLYGRLPERRKEIVRAIERVIRNVGEERLRRYRTGLRGLQPAKYSCAPYPTVSLSSFQRSAVSQNEWACTLQLLLGRIEP